MASVRSKLGERSRSAIERSGELIRAVTSASGAIVPIGARAWAIRGRGGCGWFGPKGLPSGPFNDAVKETNGDLLQLSYKP